MGNGQRVRLWFLSAKVLLVCSAARSAVGRLSRLLCAGVRYVDAQHVDHTPYHAWGCSLACAPLNITDAAFDNVRRCWLITPKGVLSCPKKHFLDNCKNRPSLSNILFLNSYPLNLIIMSGVEEGERTVYIYMQKWMQQVRKAEECLHRKFRDARSCVYLWRYDCTGMWSGIQTKESQKAQNAGAF